MEYHLRWDKRRNVVRRRAYAPLANGLAERTQIEGTRKGWMVLLSIPVIRLIRERDTRIGLQPA
jgi:hypothetical protein